MRLTGERYCDDDDWDKLRSKQNNMEDLDLSRYCFSSAYVVALLHDGLGIPFDDKRYGCSILLNWTVHEFLFLSTMDVEKPFISKLELDLEGQQLRCKVLRMCYLLVLCLQIVC